MNLNVENVHVTNWSKEPFLTLSGAGQQRLATAIRYSRQIVADACELLATYVAAHATANNARIGFHRVVNHDAVIEALRKYFGLDVNVPGQAATPAQLANQPKVQLILAKFRQIQTGINGRFDLAVGNIHDADDIKVGMGRAYNILRNGGSLGDAWHRIKFIREATEGWVRGGNVGRIHINKDVIDNYSEGKIARVIVHEASHKYANTNDVGTLFNGTDDSTGYKWDDLKHNAKGYVGLENNADSFAWGGRLMWKRKRHLASGI